MKSRLRGHTDRVRSLLIGLCLSVFICGCNSVLAADYPSWWTNRNVITNTVATNDWAAANLGQLKWFATNAYAEFETKLPGGAGTNISNMIAGFSLSGNEAAINIGQLKSVSASFWSRLIEVSYTNGYPWTTNTTADDRDFAVANIGQLKYVFSFDLSNIDADSDGLLDWWEMYYFGNLEQDGLGDYDNDGMVNSVEYLRGTPPNSSTNSSKILTWNIASSGNWTDAYWVNGPPSYPGATEDAIVEANAVISVVGTQQVNILKINMGEVSIANGAVLSPYSIIISNAILSSVENGYVVSDNTNKNAGSFAYELYAGTNSAILAGTNASLRKYGDMNFVLNGANSYSGRTQIDAGVLIAQDGHGIPSNSVIDFNGGVLGTTGVFSRTTGDSAGKVHWNDAGGFSAVDTSLVVSLDGGTTLEWSDADGLNGKTLLLGSSNATHLVEFVNAIELRGDRIVCVADNTSSSNDYARISGIVADGDATARSLTKTGAGLLESTGTNTYTGSTVINGGWLRAIEGAGLPVSSQLRFSGGVLESTGTISRQIGDSQGAVYWAGDGGFAAHGDDLSITLNEGAELDWSTSDGFNGMNLMFGSLSAEGSTILNNSISLNGERTVSVIDNTNTITDVCRFNGYINDGTNSPSSLIKAGNGVLDISSSSYSGTTWLNGGILRVGGSCMGLSSGLLRFNGGILEGCGSFYRMIDTNSGSVYWDGDGGFSACLVGMAEPLLVSLNNGDPINWGASNGFNGHILLLSSITASNVVEIQNALQLYSNRMVYVYDNPASTADMARISGIISDGDETARTLIKDGPGILDLTAPNTYSGCTIVNAGELRISGGMASSIIVTNSGSRLSGTGSVHGITINSGTVLAPGFNSLGSLVSDGNVSMATGSVYERQFSYLGSNSVVVTGDVTLASAWTLRLKDAGGVAATNDEITLFTYSGTASMADVNIDVSLVSGSTNWFTSGCRITNDVAGKRIYLTGLRVDVSDLDWNSNELPDSWEWYWFDSLTNNYTGYDDPDNDGICNFDEYANSSNPVSPVVSYPITIFTNIMSSLAAPSIAERSVNLSEGTLLYQRSVNNGGVIRGPEWDKVYLSSSSNSFSGWSTVQGLRLYVNSNEVSLSSSGIVNVSPYAAGSNSTLIELRYSGSGPVELSAPIYLFYWSLPSGCVSFSFE